MKARAQSRFACFLVAVATVAGVAAPAVRAEAGNLLVNPEAQMGLEGWNANGWGVVAFGSSANVPAKPSSAEDSDLFQASVAGATMTQDVSVAQDAAEIDAGKQPMSAAASLGAAGSGNEGAEMLLQPENASGEPLGGAVTLGPPTAKDREDKASLVRCWANFIAPVGMRSVLVTIDATGNQGQPSTAIADSVSVFSDSLGIAADGPGPVPGQGPNCYVPGPGVPAPGGITHATPLSEPEQYEPSGLAKPPLTRAQKLAQALHACKKIHRNKKRKACERTAQTHYGSHPKQRKPT
jgi:hypothetical protein